MNRVKALHFTAVVALLWAVGCFEAPPNGGDAGGPVDGGAVDSGVSDAGNGVGDGGPADAGTTDAGSTVDAGPCTQQYSVVATPISLYGGLAAGLAVDSQLNLYIAENYDPLSASPGPFVTKVTASGQRSLFVDAGILGNVAGLAVDSSDNLYIADGDGSGISQPPPLNAIWKADPQGNLTPFVPIVSNPAGLAFDSVGHLFVTSWNNKAVYEFDGSGTLVKALTTSLPMRPYGIAMSGTTAVVAGFGQPNATGTEVYAVDGTGQVSTYFDAGVHEPYAVVFDSAGNLWVSIYDGLEILRYSPSGAVTSYPGGWIGNDAANGIAIDREGSLYIAVNGGRTTQYPAVIKVTNAAPPSRCPLP